MGEWRYRYRQEAYVGRPTDEIEYEQMLLSRYQIGRHRTGALDRSAYVLLSRLRAQGPMAVGELSHALALDFSTLTRQTAAAMRAGLLERIPDPDGGIARKFRVTDKGERELDEARETFIEALDDIMSDWPDEDITAFASYLRRFNTSIERRSGRPWPRS
ncbi:MarR family winged helix-turn-helix transcriptional regulator [Spirillospora sp. NPDC048911]|uniref:MarR family winged helix-turn-helix transcriptional regulator n=1 Tax=Spirillospora sp. NPDC048911 TaxID=3364527 RepID=UPI00371B8540